MVMVATTTHPQTAEGAPPLAYAMGSPPAQSTLTHMGHGCNLTHEQIAELAPPLAYATGRPPAMAHAHVLRIWSNIAPSHSAACM